LLNETVCPDWTIRPSSLDPFDGKRSGMNVLYKITNRFGHVIPDLK